MEQNLPMIAKKVWSIARVVFLMLRKGIPKRKLIVDLNMMLKRGKIAGAKAIGNLMLHHHHRRCMPREYEFSCSNTPNQYFPSFLISKKSKNHNDDPRFFGCAHAPPTLDDEVAAVKIALDMLNNNSDAVVVVPSPTPQLPGFGWSPTVRQLRITDSPFPLQSVGDEDNGFVDKRAEEFICKFYENLRKQNKLSN